MSCVLSSELNTEGTRTTEGTQDLTANVYRAQAQLLKSREMILPHGTPFEIQELYQYCHHTIQLMLTCLTITSVIEKNGLGFCIHRKNTGECHILLHVPVCFVFGSCQFEIS